MRGRSASSKFSYYDHIVQIAAKKFVLLSLVYGDTVGKTKTVAMEIEEMQFERVWKTK